MKTCAKGIFTKVLEIINFKEKENLNLRIFFILCFNVLSKSLDVMMSQEEKLKEEYFAFMYKIMRKKIEDYSKSSSFRGEPEFQARDYHYSLHRFYPNVYVTDFPIRNYFMHCSLLPL